MKTDFENRSINYVAQGDYHLPCVTTKEQNELHIGVWANRHRQYLKQHHRIRYYNLLTSERLYPYLTDIEEQAQTMFTQLVKSPAEKELVPLNTAEVTIWRSAHILQTLNIMSEHILNGMKTGRSLLATATKTSTTTLQKE